LWQATHGLVNGAARGGRGAKDESQIDNHKYECMSSMEGGVGERRKGRGGGICGRKEVGGEGLLLVRLVIYSRFSDLVA